VKATSEAWNVITLVLQIRNRLDRGQLAFSAIRALTNFFTSAIGNGLSVENRIVPFLVSNPSSWSRKGVSKLFEHGALVGVHAREILVNGGGFGFRGWHNRTIAFRTMFPLGGCSRDLICAPRESH
jgi:hypothetical protein